MLAVAAVACSQGGDTVYRIGVSQCSSDDWRTKMNGEIHRELMFHDDATVEIRSAEDNNEKQIADIRYFIDNDFDIIIAAPNEAEPITPIIKEAYERGIPVITFDRDIIGDSYTAHIEVDNNVLGQSAARYAVARFAQRPLRIIEIQGRPNSTPTEKRHNGFVSEIARHPGVEIVASAYGDWNNERASAVADSLLRLYPDIDVVYAHNDRMAISAQRVARELGLERIRFIGIDGTPDIGLRAVADGVLDATFLYPTDGQELVRTAMAILKGEPYDRIVYLDPVSPVDASNADILLMQNNMLNDETQKIKMLQSKIDHYWEQHEAQTTLLYAVLAIVILLCGVLLLVLRMYWQHKRHQGVLAEKNRLLEEERDKQKVLYQQLEQATQSKLVFFTNVSHDLRTPLTLIAEPVSQLLEGAADQHQRALLEIANKNVKILRRLIDQILDFRKYENGKLNLNLTEANFAQLVRDWAESFHALARKKSIKLAIDLKPQSNFNMALDVGKMERVFFNLMSNAFKFTPENGSISFHAGCHDNVLTFRVKDSGIGISKEDIGRIFERFYQADKVNPNGSGIGLALVKALVELHGGTITVQSEVNAGTEFTVAIPVQHCSTLASAQPAAPQSIESELAELEPARVEIDPAKPLLLVIDDNHDIQKLVGQLMSDEYNILCASNGQNGIKLAAKYTPDLIICDVMMPVMDGLECCKIIKNEVSTSHIPILLLTACSLDEQRAEGYESGADGYLPKPFNTRVLKARCRNLIENRKRIADVYHEAAPAPAAKEKQLRDISINGKYEIPGDIDNEFYSRFVQLVDQQMGNSELSIDDLAQQMGLGKSQFSRKIKALTNYTPVELVRNMRLKEARRLLTTTDKTVSQIAYEVGFSLPAYFSKCYKDAYGESPTDLRARLGK